MLINNLILFLRIEEDKMGKSDKTKLKNIKMELVTTGNIDKIIKNSI